MKVFKKLFMYKILFVKFIPIKNEINKIFSFTMLFKRNA